MNEKDKIVEESYKEEFLRTHNIQTDEDLKKFIQKNRKPINMALFMQLSVNTPHT